MVTCIACAGTGVSSAGENCAPCHGIGVGPWISPSAVSVYRECERKWGYIYINGMRGPSKPSAALGSAVHASAEAYMMSGEITGTAQVKRLAQVAVSMAPARDPRLLREAHLFLPRDGYGFHGFADLIDPAGPTVYDYKTSSDPMRYGLDADTLTRDPQALIYAGAVMLAYEVDTVGLAWIYVATRAGKPSYPVRATLGIDTVATGLEALDSVARAMVRARSLPLGETATNAGACDNYGGCPFRGVCDVKRKTILDLAKESDNE